MLQTVNRKTRQAIVNSLVLVGVLLGLCACDSQMVFEQNIDVPGQAWSKDSIMFFNVEISDTLNAHSILLNVRHESEYPKRNLYLFVNTIAPSGRGIRDTFEILLADEGGKWYGSGLGDVFDLQVPFKHNVRFPQSGTYRFELEQAMRYDNLPNVRSVGLRVELID